MACGGHARVWDMEAARGVGTTLKVLFFVWWESRDHTIIVKKSKWVAKLEERLDLGHVSTVQDSTNLENDIISSITQLMTSLRQRDTHSHTVFVRRISVRRCRTCLTFAVCSLIFFFLFFFWWEAPLLSFYFLSLPQLFDINICCCNLCFVFSEMLMDDALKAFVNNPFWKKDMEK